VPSAQCSNNALSRLVAQLGNAVVRSFNAVAKPAGLRPIHLRAVLELSNGPLTQHELGNALGVDPTRLVVLLNELEAIGFIERNRDPEDRRRHIVVLARARAAQLRALSAALAANEEHIFGVLSADERAQLLVLLGRVAAGQPNVSPPDDDCP
jgi:DNA-binding MarR family transcriptional regulator